MAIKANTEFQIPLGVKDNASGPLKDAAGAAGDLADKAGKAGFAVIALNQAAELAAKVYAAAKEQIQASIGAYLNVEHQQHELADAMSMNHQFSERAVQDFAKFAGEMSKTTLATGGQVRSMLRMAEAYGLTNEQAKLATKAAVGLAAKLHIDVEQAMQQVVMANNGFTRGLARAIPGLKEVAEETKGTGKVFEYLAEKTAGWAEKEAQSAHGAMEQLSKSAAGLKVVFGELIVTLFRGDAHGANPTVTFITQQLQDLTAYLRGFHATMQDWHDTTVAALKGVAAGFAAVDWKKLAIDFAAVAAGGGLVAAATVLMSFSMVELSIIAATVYMKFGQLIASAATLAGTLLLTTAQIAVMVVQWALVAIGVAATIAGFELLIRNMGRFVDVSVAIWGRVHLSIKLAAIELAKFLGRDQDVKQLTKEINQLGAAVEKASKNLDTGISGDVISSVSNFVTGLKKGYDDASDAAKKAGHDAHEAGDEGAEGAHKQAAALEDVKKSLDEIVKKSEEAVKASREAGLDEVQRAKAKHAAQMDEVAKLAAMVHASSELSSIEQKRMGRLGEAKKNFDLAEQLEVMAAFGKMTQDQSDKARDALKGAQEAGASAITQAIIKQRYADIEIEKLERRITLETKITEVERKRQLAALAEASASQRQAVALVTRTQQMKALQTLTERAAAGEFEIAKARGDSLDVINLTYARSMAQIRLDESKAKAAGELNEAGLKQIAILKTQAKITKDMEIEKLDTTLFQKLRMTFAAVMDTDWTASVADGAAQGMVVAAKGGDVLSAISDVFSSAVMAPFSGGDFFQVLSDGWSTTVADAMKPFEASLNVFYVLIGAAAHAIMLAGSFVFDVLEEAVTDFVVAGKWIADNLLNGKVVQQLADIFNTFADMPFAMQTAFSHLADALTRAANTLPSMFTALISAMPKIMARITEALPAAIQAIATVIPRLAQVFADAAPKLVQGLLAGIPKLITAFSQAFQILIKAAPDIIKEVLRALPGIIMQFLNEMPKIVQSIIDAIPQILKDFVNYAPKIAEALVEGIVANIGEIVVELVDWLVNKGGIEQIARSLILIMPRIAMAFSVGVVKGLLRIFDSIFKRMGGIKMPKDLTEFPTKVSEGVAKLGKEVSRGSSELFKIMDAEQMARGVGTAKTIADAIESATNNASRKLGGAWAELKKIWDGVGASLGRLWSGLTDIWRGAVDGLMSFYNSFKGFLDALWTTIFQPIIDAFKTAFEWAAGALGQALTSIIDWVTKGGQLLADAAGSLASSLGEGAQKLLDGIVGAGKAIGEGFKAYLDTIWSWFSGAGQQIFYGLKQLLDTLWSWYSAAGMQIYYGLKAGVDTLWGWFSDAGRQVFNGLKAGLDSLWTWFRDAGKEIFEGFKSVFNIPGLGGGGGGGGGGVGGVLHKVGIGWEGGLAQALRGSAFAYMAAGGMSAFGAGNGAPRSADVIPSMLMPGEFVMSREATGKNYDSLKRMNAGETLEGGGTTIVIQKIEINAKTALTPAEIERDVVPVMFKAIKRETQRGGNLVDSRGIRSTK